MLHRAVAAFEEVFDHHLPVRLGLPLLAVVELQLVEAQAAARDDGRQVAEVVGERRGAAIEVDEQEGAPRVERHRQQGVVLHVESRLVLRPRRRAQAAVEVVGPRVVRTLERAAVAGDDLVAPVAAHVDERPESRLAAHHDHDHGYVGAGAGKEVAPSGHLRGAPDVLPRAAEDALALPVTSAASVYQDSGSDTPRSRSSLSVVSSLTLAPCLSWMDVCTM
jgi:hypothetical protein